MSWLAAPNVDSILHLGIRRDGTVLVEVNSITAKCRGAQGVLHELIEAESVDGVFVHTADFGVLRGLRFDICQVGDDNEMVMFKLFCVYDFEFLTKRRIQGLFEEILKATKRLRATDLQWKHGSEYSCQMSFSDKLKKLQEQCAADPLAESDLEFTAFHMEQNMYLQEEWNVMQEQKRREAEIEKATRNRLSVFGRIREGMRNRKIVMKKPGSEDGSTSQSTSCRDLSGEIDFSNMTEMEILRAVVAEKAQSSSVVVFDDELISSRFKKSMEDVLNNSDETEKAAENELSTNGDAEASDGDCGDQASSCCEEESLSFKSITSDFTASSFISTQCDE